MNTIHKRRDMQSMLVFISSILVVLVTVLGTFFAKYGMNFFLPSNYQILSLSNDDISLLLTKRSILFIGGPHRSGSTLLWKLLSNHTGTIAFDDNGVSSTTIPSTKGSGSSSSSNQYNYDHKINRVDFNNEGIFLQSIYTTMGLLSVDTPMSSILSSKDNVKSGLGTYAFFARNHLTETSELINNENRIKLLSEWAYHWKLNKKLTSNFDVISDDGNDGGSSNSNSNEGLLLEKSSPNMIISRFLQNMLTLNNTAKIKPSYYLYVTRHPIAVALSHRRWSTCSNMTLQELIEHWLIQHEIMMEDMKTLKKQSSSKASSSWKLIKYENLISDTNKTLKNIFKWSNLKPQLNVIHSIDSGIINGNEKYKLEYCNYITNDPSLKSAHEELVRQYDRRIKTLQLGFDYTIESFGKCEQ